MSKKPNKLFVIEKDTHLCEILYEKFKTELNNYINSRLKQMDAEIFNFKGTFESEAVV